MDEIDKKMSHNYLVFLILFHSNILLLNSDVSNVIDGFDFHLNDSNITAEIQRWRGIFRLKDNFSDLYDQAPLLILNAHNILRLKHWVPILRLDQQLNNLSQSWAKQLAQERKLRHRPDNSYGENLYAENFETGFGYPALFVRAWYSEVQNYKSELKFKDLHKISNFTQLIWKDSRYLGVGLATNSFKEVYVVCSYDPPGNIVQRFTENIIEPVFDRSGDKEVKLNCAIRSNFDKYLALATIIYVVLH